MLVRVLAMLVVVAGQAGGQIRGTIVDASNGEWLGGAHVEAVRDGRIIAQAQSDAAGRFTLRPADDRPVLLRIGRAGFVTDSISIATPRLVRLALVSEGRSPIRGMTPPPDYTSAGQSDEEPTPYTPPAPPPITTDATALLPVVTRNERFNCSIGGRTALAARALDAARGALTSLAQLRAEAPTLWTRRTERTRDGYGREEVTESRAEERDMGPDEGADAPMDSLLRHGFAPEDSSGNRTWLALRPEALLDPAFQAGQCVRAVAAPARDTSLIGVAFEPAHERRGIADVEGTLWITRRGEPAALDYRYVNLPRRIGSMRPGARLTFQRAGDGRWIVAAWTRRIPLLTVQRIRDSDVVIPGQGSTVRTEQVVSGTWETDAQVDEVWANARLVWRRGAVPLTVQVVDSMRLAPVANAVVAVDGLRDTTDIEGRAHFGIVRPGTQLARITIPQLEELGAPSETRQISVDSAAPSAARILTQNARTFVLARCGRRVLDWGEGLVAGRVPVPPDSASSFAPVTISWRIPHLVPGAPAGVVFATDHRRLDAELDGRFSVCGVPTDAEVEVRHGDRIRTLRFGAGEVAATVRLAP